MFIMPKNKKGNKEIGFLHSSLTTNYHLHTLSCDTHDKCKNKRIATMDLVLNSKYLILYFTRIGYQYFFLPVTILNTFNCIKFHLHEVLSFSLYNKDFQLRYNDQCMIQKLRKSYWIEITLFAALKMFHLITHHYIHARFYTIMLQKVAC